jgi:hypothetical protein
MKTTIIKYNISTAILLCLCYLTSTKIFAQAPIISSFTPANGAAGDTVNIIGTGFNTTLTNNIVFFGATRATVSVSTASYLKVIVPTGASFAPITILNSSNNLAGYSPQFFNPTFSPNKGIISPADIAAKIDFATNSNPYSIANGDLDGDGKPDLAIANYGNNTVSILRNIGNPGVISFASKIDFTTATKPYSIVICDMDGDGKPDLAIANDGSNSVSVLRNLSTLGSISFNTKVDFGVGSNPRSLAVGDIDGDGKPDLAVGNSASNSISVLRNICNSSNLNFASKVDFISGSSPSSVAICDIDQNGKPDIINTNYLGNNLSLLRNIGSNGNLNFATKVDINTGSLPTSVAIGDIDLDGKPDLVTTNGNGNFVSIFPNLSSNGAFNFASRVDFTTGGFPLSVAIGDIDGDGKLDLAITNYGDNSVSLIRNTSGSSGVSFNSKVDFITGAQPGSIVIGDIDGDKKPDLAIANFNGSNISVLRNNPTYFAPTISSVNPSNGMVGDTINIIGSGFNTISNNNIVFIGSTKATVYSATYDHLIISVPAGATFAPINVLNTYTNLIASSNQFFNPIFNPNKGSIYASDFSTKVDYGTGVNPQSTAIADMNGDGKSDLAVVNTNNNTVSILRNASNPNSVTLAGKVDFATGNQPYSVAIGDIDGDGKPDIAVANFSSNTVSILRNTSNNGILSFASKMDFTTGTNPTSIAIADLDGDGKLDLAITNYGDNSVSVLRNTGAIGAISFASKLDITTGSNPFSICIGDINTDNKPELVISNYGSNSISVLRNTGTSGFVSFATKLDFATGPNPWSIAIGDIDGDGKLDLTSANTSSNSVSILRNSSSIGSIGFASKIDFTTGSGPISVAIGDIDGNGKPDLAVANNGGSSNSISLLSNISNIGTINFASKVDFTSGSYPISLVIGDIDGDGKPDIATANSGSNNVSVIRNNPQFPPPVITATGSLTPFTSCSGLASAQQSFTVSGNNLFSNLLVTAPAGFEVSTTSGSGFGSSVSLPFGSGTVNPTTIYIRLTNTASGIPSGTITCSSTNITTQNLSSTGTVNALPTINFGAVSDILENATSFNLPYTSTTDSPNQYSITSGPPTAMPSFNAVANATLTATPISVSIPASTNNTYNFIATVRNSNTGCISATNAFTVRVSEPTITVAGTLSAFTTCAGTVSSSQSFSVSGINLTSNIVVAAPNGFEVSTSPSSGFFSSLSLSYGSGIVNTTNIYIRLASSAIGNPLGNVVCSSTGAINQIVFASGIVNNLPTISLNPVINILPNSTLLSLSYSATSGNPNLYSIVAGQPNSMPNFISVPFTALPSSQININIPVSAPNTYDFIVNVKSTATGCISANTTFTLPVFNIPNITSITPVNGNIGSHVYIKGSGFNSNSTNNTVFFGATKATINSCSDTIIDVIVPLGASFAPLSVLNNSARLIANSNQFFCPTFIPSKGRITSFDIASNIDFTTSSSPQSVAIGDFDGDGKLDLAIANNSSSNLSIFRNLSSSGSMSFATKSDFVTGSNPFSIAIGDIDGDGKLDLAVANNSNASVSILRNISSPTVISFANKVDLAVGTNPVSIAIGDIDKDGKPDLVVANEGSSNISVLRNTSILGVLSFAPKVDFTVGSNPRSVAFGDLNRDGKSDIAIANFNSNTLSIFSNTATNGLISFAPRLDFTVGSGPNALAFGDIDGDGKIDLAVTNGWDSSVSVLANTSSNNTISFTPKVDFRTGTYPGIVAICDIDGDGMPDLALSNRVSLNSTASVLRNISNLGLINFATKVDFTTGSYPYTLAVGDLDGDGKLDITTANLLNNTFSVLRNNPQYNALDSLTLSSGSISPTFRSTITAYSASVSNSTTSISLTPTIFRQNSTIKVRINGGTYITAQSGSSTVSLNLNIGSNIIEVQVSASDSTPIYNYTITICRLNGIGAASTTPTLSVNTLLTNITHTTFGATGIGTPTSLPTGVTAVWANNTITISGTPTSSGIFNYSIPVTGGCGNVNASGTITVTSAPPGNALNFDGSNDFVNCGNNSNVQINQGTVEAWIKTANAGTGYRGIVVKQRAYGIYLVDNVLQLYDYGSNSAKSTGINLADNRWHHIAFTFNSSITNGTIIYIDGVSKLTTTSTVSSHIQVLGIGAGQFPTIIQQFAGTIDEVRIWNIIKTSTQIQSGMLNTISPSSSGLLAYYNFDGGIAGGSNSALTKLVNQTGNINNDGTLNNFSLSGNTSNWIESYAMVVPTANAASNLGSIGFTANWSAPSVGTVNNYFLDVSTSSTFASFVSGYNGLNVSGTSQQITGLSPEITYYYRVRADKTNITGQGGISSTITTTTLSTNASLTSLITTAGALSPSFFNATYNYTVSVSNSKTSVTVTPVKSQINASIQVRINGGTYNNVLSGNESVALNLNVGINTIDVTVTAQNGINVKTYTIIVTRAPSSNANLSSLSTSVGAITPAFNANIITYYSSVTNTTTNLTITPILADTNSSLKVRINNGSYVNIINSNPAPLMNLNIGINNIDVNVLAQDGLTSKTYTIIVTRAASSNANLSSLTTTAGTLTPTFVPDTTTYYVSVNNSVSSINITPTLADSTASIMYRINNGNYSNVLNSNSSSNLNLNVGSNLIEILVVAQDSTSSKTYTIMVTRAILINQVQLSLVAFLEGLYLGNGLMISAPFAADGITPNTIADTITVELHDTITPFISNYSVKGTLSTTGTANITFPATAIGNSYFVVVKHRNSIPIWSASPLFIDTIGTSYNFSISASSTLGNNLSNDGNGIFMMYTGDINQDGSVDFNDYPPLDISSNNGDLGYNVFDLNGDSSVDFNDYPILDINSNLGIIEITP